MARFLEFFACDVVHDHVDGWTPAVTRAFQAVLHESVSPRTGKTLAATTVNRVLATLRTFAGWVQTQPSLLVGSPFAGVEDRAVDAAAWNGLFTWQVTRLAAAVDMRMSATRKNQAPLLEAAALKRVADKHGVHVAQQMSGNVNIREVFRYTKPSDDEVQATAEWLFQ